MQSVRPARTTGDVFSAGCHHFGPLLMRDLGLTDIQAAGLLGNLGHESGGFRQLQEIAPAVPGSRGGWGLPSGPVRGGRPWRPGAKGMAPTFKAAMEAVCRHFERPESSPSHAGSSGQGAPWPPSAAIPSGPPRP
jgi:hypothetical protein